ncbi:MAG: hypothetical protein J6Y94_06565, partial [Bacteriovoracaceae bacterium]|nr:hypothetical protein [Bacteriovoracaceae bacterium]
DENFVEEFTSQESLPALAKQAFQEVSLEIFSLYLQEEGLTTFEHWPKVMDFLPGSWAYQHLALLKNALVDPERYTLNLWTSTSKLALQQSAQDASVAEWINFTNDVLKTLHKFPWANGQKFGQAFAYINFSLIFDFPAWTKNDVPATLQSYAQVKQHPWIMDHLVNTELAQITYQDRGNVQQTKVINLDYHLLPGAWANATLRNRQWKQELTNANVPHANNKHAKKLRLLGRFMKYNRELQKGQTPLLDTVVNLIPTNRQACAKNFLKP